MAIVCGIDFSEASSRAVTAAAHLAVRMKMPLHLVHTIEIGHQEGSPGPGDALRIWTEGELHRRAEQLRKLGALVEIHVSMGLPDEVVLAVASQVSAKLIVVGPVGRRRDKTMLGSHADRIAQRSHVPVLVVRNVEPFSLWARESKPLRIAVGADPSMSSENAVRWVNELRSFGPCEVVAIQLYWPPEQFHRLGLGGVRSVIQPDPEVTLTLERELSERMSRLPGAGPVKLRAEPHLGRIADRLVDLAAEEKADLVVVGSRGRNVLARMWEGSVSRGVLHWARASVACVPAPAGAQVRATPRIGTVLVATDFSPVGDAAIPLAYSAAAPGGAVHLVHVIRKPFDILKPHDVLAEGAPGRRSEASQAARERLLHEVPADAAAGAKSTHVHVLESDDPAEAICQAAERLGADLVCLGTHGRSGPARALLGSVAQAVLSNIRRPVLLVRAPAG